MKKTKTLVWILSVFALSFFTTSFVFAEGNNSYGQENTTSTSSFSCNTDLDCREMSCPKSGGFVHEKCIQGKCVISDEVKAKCSSTTSTNNLVGNDRDVHGCIGSAGYSWCAEKGKCLRSWEEKCQATSSVKESDAASTLNEDKEDIGRGDEHRNGVAIFVKGLLEVSGRVGRIGEKVRTVAQEQASTTEKTIEAIDKVEKRSNFKTFLIGSDYKNLGAIRQEIVQTRNRLNDLNRDLEKVASSTSKTAVMNQIQLMEQEQTKLENFVNTNENRFSLFGWFVKMF